MSTNDGLHDETCRRASWNEHRRPHVAPGVTDSLTFTDAVEQSRFELRDAGELVSVLDYRINGDTIALTRAFTNPAKRGSGYAAIVTERAVDAIESAGERRVSPVCWYVADWFDAHPERAKLLADA
ncbi:MAG TPA: N-acetyltransferase [Candidatus Microbacterium pullistercoris]|nr:N-acetyltransferase [Candidatus Microbacterium pullistercoris]